MKLFARFSLILLSFSLTPVLITGMWVVRSQTAARENSRQLHLQVTKLFADSVESFAGDMNRALGFAQELERISLAASKGSPSLEGGRSPLPKGATSQGAPSPKGAVLPLPKGGPRPGAPRPPAAKPAGRPSDEYKILQRAAAGRSALGLVSLIGPDGYETVRFADAQAYPATGYEDRSSDPLVAQARATGKAAWGRVVLRRGTPFMPIVHPLPQDNILYVEYSLAALLRRFQEQAVGKNGRLLLVDESGKPLPGFGGDFPEPGWGGLKPQPDASGWLDTVATRRGPMVAAWAACPSLGWRVLSLQPRAEALAASPHFLAQAAGFLLSLTGLVILCALWMGSRMANPLQALIAGAQRAARSEFEKPVPESGWGELSLLTRGFNVMMRTLRAYQEMQVDRLLEEKAKLESLVHTIPDGIVLASFDGKIVYMNITARALLSGESGDITGPPLRTVHDTFREPALRDMVLSLLQRRKASESRELELHGTQGHRRGIFLCRAVTVLHNNREIGIVMTMRDMTAERDLTRLREDFYHGIVHDLRGPLTNVDGFIRIMQARWGNIPAEQVTTYLGYVRRSTERMRQLVTDILETAKIESGTLQLSIEPVAAADFVERTKALYALQTETIGVAMSFEMGTAPAQPLRCDRNLVERVLMNLLDNALKFTPRGGKVTMRVTAAGPAEAEFSVQDTGSGIPKDKLELVFDKFRQLESGKKSAGYGLGLSICKKIVELHHGRIWVESEAGQGSRFVFRLPLQGPAVSLPAA